MRIGIDLLALQSPSSARRGIGRYGGDLLASLLARASGDGDRYVLYRHEGPGLADPEGIVADSAEMRTIRRGAGQTASGAVDDLVRRNPDGLDAFLVLSPFEVSGSYLPPAAGPDRPALVAVIYDLIPFLFPPPGVPIHPHLRSGPHAVRALGRFDGLLAISESARRDAIRYWDVDPSRIATVGTAADASRFRPASGPRTEADRSALAAMGVTRPFVFFVGGMDSRKNFRGLVEAFSLLPEPLRATHQLVVACRLDAHAQAHARDWAESRGVGGSLVLAGEVSDETLARLYQGCALFAFPSTYEGFGLPILEAMMSGAAVVAADNSAQPEVVGDAGLLADAADPSAFAARMAAILGDPAYAADLRARSLVQAGRFSWRGVAEAARATIAQSVRRRGPAVRPRPCRPARPPLAFVSPLPPRNSGVADHAARLLDELRRDYRIDLFHDGAYAPLPSLAEPDFAAADIRLLPRLAARRGYRAIVYQMGNSSFHQFLYPALREIPGIVTLHDLCLAGFHMVWGRDFGLGDRPFRDEMAYCHPGDHPEVLATLDETWPRIDPTAEMCASQGLWLNRRVLEAAEAVVVHSPWCRSRIADQGADLARKSEVIPLGAAPEEVPADRRAAIRARFGVAPDALVVASLGAVHPNKMVPEAIAAFAHVARRHPEAVYLFGGAEGDGGEARLLAESLGLAGRVRFLGRLPLEEFCEVAAITDIGVNLRRPPTFGETSAALLDFLRHGVATIITDAGTFADYPPGTVASLRWPGDGQEGLNLLMMGLAEDPSRRSAMGQEAREHVRRHHRWPDVAALYGALIERTAARRKQPATAFAPGRGTP